MTDRDPPEIPPQAVIIAGPNGSGKSTCSVALLTQFVEFVNADLIAQEITGHTRAGADIGAGRLFLRQVERLAGQRRDFAIETTLATRSLAERVVEWRSIGYRVHLVFLWLPSAELAVQRVAFRVLSGGHDVPERTIRRRFAAGLRNLFRIYIPIVDTWRVYDNSRGADPVLIASGVRGGSVKVAVPEAWESLVQEYGS
ncbi:MAG: zeta toxin family protein [Fimbriimonadales bacterium]|nr:zeta toxin family protein [Fimbriimonadales bacterium]